ncbi:MAG: ATP-binding protein, partial [Cyanobacteria bacterium REEB446]|nr:ATP-binding protein [Cyanobacteria bacterium REEB446]
MRFWIILPTSGKRSTCLREQERKFMTSCLLFDELNVSKGEGSYIKFLDRLAKKDLLVIDDWGLNPFSETH